MTPVITELLPVAHVAERWGVSVSTVRRAIAAGALPTVRPSPGVLRVPASALANLERPLVAVPATKLAVVTAEESAPTFV